MPKSKSKYHVQIGYNKCEPCNRVFKMRGNEQISKLYLIHMRLNHGESGKYKIQAIQHADQRNTISYNTDETYNIYHK